jgi:hypothetical protein
MFRCRDHLTTAEGNIFPGNGKAIDKGEQCAVLKLMLDPKCTNDNVYEEYPKRYVKNPKCTNDNVYEEYPKRYVKNPKCTNDNVYEEYPKRYVKKTKTLNVPMIMFTKNIPNPIYMSKTLNVPMIMFTKNIPNAMLKFGATISFKSLGTEQSVSKVLEQMPQNL